MAFTPAPTQSYQDCIFSKVSVEDQAHIDAMKPHFFALHGKFTRTQIYELLTSNRMSSSSFITRSSTPSTQRSSSSFGCHSSSNASFRSSITSMTSASSSNFTQDHRPITPCDQPQSLSLFKASDTGKAHLEPKSETLSPSPRGSSIAEDNGLPLLYCPCPGHEKSTFKRKGDWKDHMDSYHKPGPIAWNCHLDRCERRFETVALFRQHHASDHHCRRGCTHADKSEVSVPSKLAFACGFHNCSSLLTTWDNWRDHVRDHLLGGNPPTSWSYTTEFRNLLRREEISSFWDSYVKLQLRVSEGHRHIFSWEPSTTSELKRHLEFSPLLHGREQLIDEIFLAAMVVHSQTDFQTQPSPLANIWSSLPPLSSMDDTYIIPESNAVQSLSFSDLTGDGLQTAAFSATYDPNQSSFHYKHQQTSFLQTNNASLDHSMNLGLVDCNSSWNQTQPITPQISSTNLSRTGLENQLGPQRSPEFWFPGLPDDPVATYGLPPNALTNVDQQHARSKSTSKNSLGKKISGYFTSSGRKPTHSRSGSDGSDQRMGGVQAYY